jgi:tetratricopeptide (TPR) repeat protein
MGEVVQAVEAAKNGDSSAAFDPGRTVPMAPPPGGEEVAEEEDVPAFLRGDTRVFDKPQQRSKEEIADTQVRCKESAHKLRAEGKLAQAARELRRLLEIVPDDEETKKELREIEQKLSEKRAINGEIRSMVASSHYEEAMERWDALDDELRDEQLAAQMERLASTVVPALRQVAKADQETEAGHLEEAVRLYHEAIKLDPGSEKAKQGLKNVERTKQRIQFLLKEGYTHRQNRDYGQAVEVWQKILSVEPDNNQARRLIVEARMAAAGEGVNNEDFDKVVKHCEAVLKIEPKHADAGRMLADASTKRDRVAQLRRAAEMARSKGDLGGSIKAYRELTRLIPKSKVAHEGLTSTRKAMTKRRSKRLVVLLILVFLGGGGYLVVRDYMALRSARIAFSQGRFDQGMKYASKVKLPIFKGDAQKEIQTAWLRHYDAKALEAEKNAKWQDEVKYLKKLLEKSQDPSFVRRKNIAEYHLNIEKARKLESEAGADSGKWTAASTSYYDAAGAAEKVPDLNTEKTRAEKIDAGFCSHVARGIKYHNDGSHDDARDEFVRALRLVDNDTDRITSGELRKMMNEVGVSISIDN